jgi:type IV pilus assembly protein PilB
MAKKKKLGEHLIESGLLRAPQLEEALRLQKETNDLLGKILQSMGLVSEEDVVEVLAKQLAMPIASAEEMKASGAHVKLIPLGLAKKHNVFPLKEENGRLTLAMANPFDWRAADEVSFTTGLKVIPVLATGTAIQKALERQGGSSVGLDNFIRGINTGVEDRELQVHINGDKFNLAPLNDVSEHNLDSTPVIVKLVTSVMSDAAKCRASDIHIEPSETAVTVRYRIDGVLKTMFHYPLFIHDAVVSRIKVVSSLDITNKRLPQDGRTVLRLEDREINIRLSTLPSFNGEKVVLRLLDDSVALLPMPALGLPEYIYKSLNELLGQPQGMILVTGPTGSGKTTTLYSLLNQIQSDTKNIITVEDPVEYRVAGTTQVGINPPIGLTFASVLRHILRQDPDTIMIGEIRDTDTAEIAVQAALTGHLVLSTLHTNNTVAAITRLIDLGLSPNLLASSVTAILAQRLIRLVCPKCKIEIDPPEIARGLQTGEVKAFFKGKGCPDCKHTGYKGRTGVYEYLPMDTNLKQLVALRSPEEELQKAARLNGMISLMDDAWAKIQQGVTTVEEVLSKVPPDLPRNSKNNQPYYSANLSLLFKEGIQ